MSILIHSIISLMCAIMLNQPEQSCYEIFTYQLMSVSFVTVCLNWMNSLMLLGFWAEHQLPMINDRLSRSDLSN